FVSYIYERQKSGDSHSFLLHVFRVPLPILSQGFYIVIHVLMKTMEFSRKGGHILSSNVVKKTEDLVLPILKEKSLGWDYIEYTIEGCNRVLRVYKDKNGGIEIDECGLVSEKFSE